MSDTEKPPLFWTTRNGHFFPVIKETKAFFMTGGRWVPRIKKAYCFGRFATKEEAQDFCIKKDSFQDETRRLLAPHYAAIDEIKASRAEEFSRLFNCADTEPDQ